MMSGVSQSNEDQGPGEKPLPPFTMPGQPSASGPWQSPGPGPAPGQAPPPPGSGQPPPPYGAQAQPPGSGQPSPPYGGQPQYGGRGAFGGNPPPYGQAQQPYGGPGQPPGGYQPYPQAGYGGAHPPGKDPALAEWWRRLLARIIDGIVLGVLLSPLWVSALLTTFHRLGVVADQYPDMSTPIAQAAVRHAISQMTGRFVLIGLVAALLAFGYDWLQHGLWGQTLGKRALGTKVVTANGHARIGGGAACGRAAVYAIVSNLPYVGSLFWLINVLWLTWDQRRQCLHDKAAGTVVVKKSMLSPPETAPAAPPPW
jgi:uncharacterized RDD family membrane protein YckC